MVYKYVLKTEKEKTAQATGLSLNISMKQGVEICNFIRGKTLDKAKKLLNEVAEEKRPVPFKRFNKDVGHKKGMAAGRYPKKASLQILSIIENAEANAQFKGLNTANLIVKHILAQNASRPFHFGRKRRRKMKRAHIEVILEEAVK